METSRNLPIESIEGVCEVVRVGPPELDPSRPADLLIELPHGASEESHYAAVRRRLRSPLPPDLEKFFYVNTDAGAPECAGSVARIVAGAAGRADRQTLTRWIAGTQDLPVRTVWIVRCLVPRTFIDCNRIAEAVPAGDRPASMTPAVPDYVTDPGDVRWLRGLHQAYQRTARRAYEAVCGAGGLAVTLHTYAPRSVGIDRLDDQIVVNLERAYDPETYATWPRRPQVDLITRTSDGRGLAPERLVSAVHDCYARSGIETVENATYCLHEGTMGLEHSLRHPGKVLCLEINRELLAERFLPFVRLPIDARKVETMAAPLAAACVLAMLGSCD